MKLKYHKKDALTWEQALETLKIKEHCNVVGTKVSASRTMVPCLIDFSGNFKAGTIKKNHIFRVKDMDASLSMQCVMLIVGCTS
jgi:hypothetical protein